jgi:hypothetical protein
VAHDALLARLGLEIAMLPEREIMTGIGPVAVRQPRVRDREATEGARIRYSPYYLRAVCALPDAHRLLDLNIRWLSCACVIFRSSFLCIKVPAARSRRAS